MSLDKKIKCQLATLLIMYGIVLAVRIWWVPGFDILKPTSENTVIALALWGVFRKK